MLTTLVLLGGIILTVITLGLFTTAGFDIGEWYFEYVVVCRLIAAPTVATYIYDVITHRSRQLVTILVLPMSSPRYSLSPLPYA